MRERNPCRRRVLTPEADYDRLQSGVGAVEPDELPRAGKVRRPLIICNDVLVNGLPLQMVCKVIRRSTRARGCRSLFACRCDRKPPPTRVWKRSRLSVSDERTPESRLRLAVAMAEVTRVSEAPPEAWPDEAPPGAWPRARVFAAGSRRGKSSAGARRLRLPLLPRAHLL